MNRNHLSAAIRGTMQRKEAGDRADDQLDMKALQEALAARDAEIKGFVEKANAEIAETGKVAADTKAALDLLSKDGNEMQARVLDLEQKLARRGGDEEESGTKSYGEQFTASDDFEALAAEAQAAGITTSTIAIGSEADFERLEEIASAGGGRYYEALDVSTLPRIFSNEALTATRALLVEEPTVPRGRPNQLYDFPAALPPVDAYVATSIKSDAQELLSGREGEPLLAVRRAGLGRTAALTTDLNGWAGSFGSWQGLPGALGTLGRWLQAVPPGYDATANRDGNELEVVVDAVLAGEYVNGERLSARFGGATVQLDQVGPGRYVGRVPWIESAGQEVVVARDGDVVARASVTGPDPEFADIDGARLLEAVAQRTGGAVVTGETYEPELAGGGRSIWQWFLTAAVAVFIAELAWRRLAPATTTAARSATPVSPRGRWSTARLRRPS